MPCSLADVRSAAIDGRAQNAFFKKEQLKKLHEKLVENVLQIQDAISSDTGHRLAEVKLEYCLALECVAECFGAINPKSSLHDEYAIARSEDAPNAREAIGIVVIVPTTHTFLFSLVSALAPALAAGNCIIVQMEQTMLKTPRVVLDIISQALDKDIFHVTSKQLSDAEINHQHIRILQSGTSNARLGNQIVSPAEARVVAVIERDADLQAAAEAVVRARFSLGGRSPYAPDLVLVNEWIKKDFLAAVTQCAVRFAPDTTEILSTANKRKHGVANQVIDERRCRVISSDGSGLIVDVEDRETFLLQSKVKEPCITVYGVRSMDDAIDITRSSGRHLALYVFTAMPAAAKYIAQFIDADVAFINQIPVKILFGPANPEGRVLLQNHAERYDMTQFSLPSPQYVSHTKDDQTLSSLLSDVSARELRKFEQKAMAPLPEVKRKNWRTIGFFEQGIMIGGSLLLTTVMTCTGVLCYYTVRFVRPSH